MTLRNSWRGLQPRERLVLAGGAAIVALGLGYAYLWQPVAQERLRLRQALPVLRVQAARLDAARDEAIGLRRQTAQAVARGNLRQVLEESAAALDLRRQIERLETEGDNRAVLAAGAVPFDAWVRWLKALQNAQGVRVESCTVEATGTAGIVRVRATMVRE